MGWVVNEMPRPLYARLRALVAIVEEAEWVPGSVSTSMNKQL
jgi:hypothetical protein